MAVPRERLWAVRAAYLLGLAAIAAIAIADALVTRGFVYDEQPYVLDTLGLLDRYGLTPPFLRGVTHTAGISFGILHWSLRSLTGMTPHLVRLVNPALCVLLLWFVRDIVRRFGVRYPGGIALTMLAVPSMWVLTGLALTEMLGMVSAIAGLWVFLIAVTPDRPARSTTTQVALAGAGGILVGLAFFSRPPLLILTFAPAAMLALKPRPWRPVIAFWLGAMAALSPALLVWGGLVPPRGDFSLAADWSVPFTVLALGYGGCGLWIICPGWYRLGVPATAVLFLAGVAANVLFRFISIATLATIAHRLVPDSLQPIYPVIVGCLCAGVAAVFVASMIHNLYANRTDPTWLVMAAGMFLTIVSVGKLTEQFSSRYPAAAAPLMVIAGARYVVFSPSRVAWLAGGMVLGAASLASYLVL